MKQIEDEKVISHEKAKERYSKWIKKIITVYEPDPEEWEDFKKRRH